MKNKKVIALIILGIGAVVSLIYGVTAPPKRSSRVYTKPGPTPGFADNKTVYRPAGKIIPTKRRTKRTEFDSWGKNPFITQKVKIAERPALGGIMWTEKNPKAVIGSEMVSRGDVVGGYRVVEIRKDRVILKDGAEEIILKLE
ncbi:MAG: hypothetical protein NG740_00820 [Omnitrophica bacterium]|nr:hypothetical protein [Candidatus Omnitrophota bacterium]